MNISINMLMKIALVLITILLVAAAFINLLDEGGNTLKDQETENNKNLDCIMDNKDDAYEECNNPTSFEINDRGVANEV